MIVDDGKYELYYDHWCANCLDEYLFWGIERALAFFRDREKQGDDWWLDTTWCEGGAVIDLDRKVLLWFGGEDICYDIPLRRQFIELMQKNWAGYEIRWAYDGVADLADYVGHGREKVIVPFDEKNLFSNDKSAQLFSDSLGLEYWNTIISIRNNENIIELYKGYLTSSLRNFLYFGSDLVKMRGQAIFLTEYIDNGNEINAINSGIHIDLVSRELHIWNSDYRELFDRERLQAVWKEYRIFFHGDEFEIHSKLADGKLRFAERNRSDLIAAVKTIVCRDAKNPLDSLNTATHLLREQGKNVEVNSAVFMANQYVPGIDKETQEKLFDELFKG